MTNKNNKANISALLALYILLAAFFITTWNMSNLGAQNWLILIVIELLLTTILWKYFNRKAIVKTGFFSSPLQKGLPKSEQVFPMAIPYLVMPVWKFTSLSTGDILVSVIIFIFTTYRIYKMLK